MEERFHDLFRFHIYIKHIFKSIIYDVHNYNNMF